jgi:hypothetical protein
VWRTAIRQLARSGSRETRLRSPLGYGSLNGSALSAISAGLKYGLLEKLGEGCRIADRSVLIFRPKDQREKAQAIWDAASAPALFADLMEAFPGMIPPESDMREYLKRRGFAKAALTGVSQAFRETFELVLAEAHGHNPPLINAAGKSPLKRNIVDVKGPIEIAAPRMEVDKMRVMVTETGVEVSAMLTTNGGVDRLIRALEANRQFVTHPMDAPAVNNAEKRIVPEVK